MKYLTGLLMIVALSGCGRGVCPASSVTTGDHTSPCGYDLYRVDGKTYSPVPIQGIAYETRYFPIVTPPGQATTFDACYYVLSKGWYGDSDCIFLVD